MILYAITNIEENEVRFFHELESACQTMFGEGCVLDYEKRTITLDGLYVGRWDIVHITMVE